MIGLLALAAAAVAVPPPSMPGVDPGDVRCAIVSFAVTANSDPAIRSAGLIASMYWFGRIDHGASDTALTQMIAAEAARMTGADIKLEAQRCGTALQARGAAMQRIGAALQALGAGSDTR